jgi:hypothetical protein
VNGLFAPTPCVPFPHNGGEELPTRVHQPHSFGARGSGFSQAGSPHSLPSPPLIRGERVRMRGDSIPHVGKKFPCEPASLDLIAAPLPREGLGERAVRRAILSNISGGRYSLS